MTFSMKSVICRLVDSCMSGDLTTIVLSHLQWTNNLLSIDAKLPTLKAQIKILVTSLPKTVAAFEADPAGHFFHSRD